jgi:hypothetical protein
MKAKPLTENSTAEDYLALHKELWTWLAKHPKATKKTDWPRWKSNGGDIEDFEGYCFACDFDAKGNNCDSCLLNWGNDSNTCSRRKGLFWQWLTATGPSSRSALALKIANLPLQDRWKK